MRSLAPRWTAREVLLGGFPGLKTVKIEPFWPNWPNSPETAEERLRNGYEE
jgi:hypothetical protein